MRVRQNTPMASFVWPPHTNEVLGVQSDQSDPIIRLVLHLYGYTGQMKHLAYYLVAAPWRRRYTAGSDKVEIEFFMILAATMLRSTTWPIVTAHINSNEFGEDLIVIFANDVFASMRKGGLGSATANVSANGPEAFARVTCWPRLTIGQSCDTDRLTIDSINIVAEWFFASFTCVIGTDTDEGERSEVYNVSRNSTSV